MAGRGHTLPNDILRTGGQRKQILPVLFAFDEGAFPLHAVDITPRLQLGEGATDSDPADSVGIDQLALAWKRLPDCVDLFFDVPNDRLLDK